MNIALLPSGQDRASHTAGDAIADLLVDQIVSFSGVPSLLEDKAHEAVSALIRDKVKGVVDGLVPPELKPGGSFAQPLAASLAEPRCRALHPLCLHAQVGALSGRRVIVPDLLWFGQSHSPRKDYSIAHQVRTLIAVLDRLKIERADLVGISYGGLVAYELARLHPGRVRRLVMVDSPGRVYTMRDYRELCLRFAVKDVGAILAPDDVAGVERLLDLAYWDPPFMPEFVARQVLRELYTPFRSEKIALLHALLEDLKRPRPEGRVSASTLIIWGREDPVFPLELGQRLAKEIGPNARLVVIDRARHAPNLERPATFNGLLAGFLLR